MAQEQKIEQSASDFCREKFLLGDVNNSDLAGEMTLETLKWDFIVTSFVEGAKSEAAREFWFEKFKTEKTLVKERVCTSCLSPHLIYADCVCTYKSNYKTVELEFEVDILGNIDSNPAETDFNTQQLKTYL